MHVFVYGLKGMGVEGSTEEWGARGRRECAGAGGGGWGGCGAGEGMGQLDAPKSFLLISFVWLQPAAKLPSHKTDDASPASAANRQEGSEKHARQTLKLQLLAATPSLH